jgi:hypothetical protein
MDTEELWEQENYATNGNRLKSLAGAGCQWLTPVILAFGEAEVGRIEV